MDPMRQARGREPVSERVARRGKQMPYYRCAACGLTSYVAAAHTGASVCPNCSATLDNAKKLDPAPGWSPITPARQRRGQRSQVLHSLGGSSLPT